ncbi:hypothetical protein MCUN1_001782 [Malassezia cuniculi]|uniref:Uncharacterized protein n=1 Tax=Malassezia cuniculi TaxID=948313 RepID=A0AAF0JB42_9BASI|nr:hypothetical protein MCUN1_001782 [Malassezia cuniculi]
MSAATAQRRISWNVAALIILWALPAAWGRIPDMYYDALVALDNACESCHIDIVDIVVSWLRAAATIVFVFNIGEALMARPAASLAAPANGVGEALARGAKGTSVVQNARNSPAAASPARSVFARPAVPSPTHNTPWLATPMRGGSPFDGRRSVSPFQRASSAISSSPRPFERRFPSSTPFSTRSPSASRTPSLAEAFAGRSASRSPGRSPTMSPGAHSDIDDALEVERALEQLNA